MSYCYIIIDVSEESALQTKAIANEFPEFDCVGMAFNSESGIELVLDKNPDLIFLEIAPSDKKSQLSLAFISEMYRFLDKIPKVIVTTASKNFAFEAIDYGVLDYLIKPIQAASFLKLKHKLIKKESQQKGIIASQSITKTANFASKTEENQPTKTPLIICIKSYGDYRYINAADICYFQADNNSTDIHLNSGEMITAFKTLKHFESVLSHPFIRIHNSYIVNRHFIARIQTGNSLCFIKNSSIKLPFSKSYKANIDLIIAEFATNNYIEI